MLVLLVAAIAAANVGSNLTNVGSNLTNVGSNLTNVTILPAVSMSAECHDKPAEFDCQITDIPVIGNVGLEAKIIVASLELDVYLLIAGKTYELAHISAGKPQACVHVAVVGEVCVKVDHLQWLPTEVTGTIYIGVGVLGIFKWFKIYTFHIPTGGPPPSSPNTIRYLKDTSKCLDLPGGDTTNGNKLWVWDCNGSPDQQWVFGAGTWQINFKSNPSKCVDIPGGSLKDGNVLQIWDCVGVPGQRWGYDGRMHTIYAAASSTADASKCMDLTGGSAKKGTRVEVWDCNGLDNQKWAVG